VSNVRPNGLTEDQKVIQYSLAFTESPYAIETMDALEKIRNNEDQIMKDSRVEGELHFAGETTKKVDDRSTNDRDLIVIVLLESVLIFVMLIIMTKSIKMPIYMLGTILVAFLAAVGLGKFLSNLFFDIDTISNRVPLYSFVFLVALGIDYNIILISRFMEERKNYPVKKAAKQTDETNQKNKQVASIIMISLTVVSIVISIGIGYVILSLITKPINVGKSCWNNL
jgi:putative drug exporter of the RND superfamily